MPYTEEQLNQLPTEELIALKAKLQEHRKILERPKSGFNLTGALVGGLRGITEGKIPAVNEKTSTTDEINNFIAKERLKQVIEAEKPKTASENLADLEWEETQRKLREGNAPIPPTTDQPITTPTSVPKTIDEAPPMFITVPKGKNKYGVMEYDTKDNPEYTRWSKVQEDKDKNAEQNKLHAQGVKDAATDALKSIAEVEKGMDYFGAYSYIPTVRGTPRFDWQQNLNQLLSSKVIDVMTKMKEASKTGATGFGQLSEKELKVLQDASTALKEGVSPEKAQAILNEMKVKLQKITNETPQSKTGGQVMVDAQGNKAMVYPDGSFEEMQ